jgi:hypothetical protein
MRRVPAFAFVVLLLVGCGSAATGSPPPSLVATVPSTTAPSAAPSSTPTVATPVPITPSAKPVPSPTPRTYVVQAGDVPGRIASGFGITVLALTRANPTVRFVFQQTGPDPSHTFAPGWKDIQIGDVLIIPAP